MIFSIVLEHIGIQQAFIRPTPNPPPAKPWLFVNFEAYHQSFASLLHDITSKFLVLPPRNPHLVERP